MHDKKADLLSHSFRYVKRNAVWVKKELHRAHLMFVASVRATISVESFAVRTHKRLQFDLRKQNKL